MLFGRLVQVMASSKGRLTNTTARHRNLIMKKSLIWIRPQNLPIEMDRLTYKVLPAPRRPAWKNMLRFATDILGVIVLLTSCWFVLSQMLQVSHARMNQPGTPAMRGCANLGRCIMNPATSTRSSWKSIQFVTTDAPSAPTEPPGQVVNTTSSSTPSSSPTPSVAVLSVPSILSMSYALKCATGQPGLLTLSNIGGAVLVWLEDKLHSSQQLSVSDPTKSYLIQPGKNIAAYVKCSPEISVGNYNLQILYNGGSTSITVKITT